MNIIFADGHKSELQTNGNFNFRAKKFLGLKNSSKKSLALANEMQKVALWALLCSYPPAIKLNYGFNNRKEIVFNTVNCHKQYEIICNILKTDYLNA